MGGIFLTDNIDKHDFNLNDNFDVTIDFNSRKRERKWRKLIFTGTSISLKTCKDTKEEERRKRVLLKVLEQKFSFRMDGCFSDRVLNRFYLQAVQCKYLRSGSLLGEKESPIVVFYVEFLKERESIEIVTKKINSSFNIRNFGKIIP